MYDLAKRYTERQTTKSATVRRAECHKECQTTECATVCPAQVLPSAERLDCRTAVPSRAASYGTGCGVQAFREASEGTS